MNPDIFGSMKLAPRQGEGGAFEELARSYVHYAYEVF